MYLSITIPALIFNSITSYLAFLDIKKRNSMASFSPRIVLIAFIIFGYLPISLLSVSTFIINFNLLSYNPICFLYVFIASIYNLSVFAQFFLSIYMSLLIFTSLDKITTDKIGKYFVYSSIVLLCLVLFLLVPIGGANPLREKEFFGRTYPRHCDIRVTTVKTILMGLFIATFILSLSMGICLSVLQIYRLWFGYKKQQGRIILSFILFSLINLHTCSRYILVSILKVKLSDMFIFILTDTMKWDGGLFALVYLLLDGRMKERPFTLQLKKVLEISAIRKCFKKYLAVSCASQKNGNNLVREWETLTQSNGSADEDKKQQRINYLEKQMELHLVGFFESWEWEQFYPEYCRMGKVEEQLLLR